MCCVLCCVLRVVCCVLCAVCCVLCVLLCIACRALRVARCMMCLVLCCVLCVVCCALCINNYVLCRVVSCRSKSASRTLWARSWCIWTRCPKESGSGSRPSKGKQQQTCKKMKPHHRLHTNVLTHRMPHVVYGEGAALMLMQISPSLCNEIRRCCGDCPLI